MKRLLSAQEEQHLRAVLQTATLAALMDARRWEPGDLAFQGGTSLHLAYGSARFSEDLDFLVRGGLSLQGLAKQVRGKLRLPASLAADMSLSVSPGKDVRNPHMFYVTLSGAQVVGSAKVKVELWQAPASALKTLALKVSTVQSSAGQAFVPTLSLDEILADKIYALGARARIKPRDVFDLWWLRDKGLGTPGEPALRTRLAMYPAASGQLPDTAQAWLTNAAVRLHELRATDAPALIATDLKRWLPSFWPLTLESAQEMTQLAIDQLEYGMQVIEPLSRIGAAKNLHTDTTSR